MKRGRGQKGDKETGERRDKKGEQTGKRRRKGKEGEKEYVGDHGLLGILEEHVIRDTNPLRIQGSGPRVQVSRGNFAFWSLDFLIDILMTFAISRCLIFIILKIEP